MEIADLNSNQNTISNKRVYNKESIIIKNHYEFLQICFLSFRNDTYIVNLCWYLLFFEDSEVKIVKNLVDLYLYRS